MASSFADAPQFSAVPPSSPALGARPDRLRRLSHRDQVDPDALTAKLHIIAECKRAIEEREKFQLKMPSGLAVPNVPPPSKCSDTDPWSEHEENKEPKSPLDVTALVTKLEALQPDEDEQEREFS